MTYRICSLIGSSELFLQDLLVDVSHLLTTSISQVTIHVHIVVKAALKYVRRVYSVIGGQILANSLYVTRKQASIKKSFY